MPGSAVQGAFDALHVLFAVFKLARKYLDGIDFYIFCTAWAGKFARKEPHHVPEKYREQALPLFVTVEQALGVMAVDGVGDKPCAFVVRKKAFVLYRARGNAFLDAYKRFVPGGAETFCLFEEFQVGFCVFERREGGVYGESEGVVEFFGQSQGTVGEGGENLFALVKHLVADFAVVIVDFVFGFATLFGGERKRAFAFEQQQSPIPRSMMSP